MRGRLKLWYDKQGGKWFVVRRELNEKYRLIWVIVDGPYDTQPLAQIGLDNHGKTVV